MILHLDDLVIDTQRRTVRQGGDALKLQDLTFDLLAALVHSAPELMDTQALAERVWKAAHVSADTIAQRVALLRKALGDDPRDPRYIRTVRGAGYAVIGEVRLAEEEAESEREISPQRSLVISAAALVGVAATFLWWQGQSSTARTAATSTNLDAIQGLSTNALLIERANAQLGLHQPAETQRALAMLRTAVERDPTSFQARLSLALALTTFASKFDGDVAEKNEAEALTRELIEERPENANAWSALGYVLSAKGRGDEALAAYRRAIALDPDNSSARSSAGHLLLLKGDVQQALLLEQSVRARGRSSKYSEIQIAQALELIDHPAAERWRDQALTLNPGQVVVVKEAAASELRQGKPQAALLRIKTYEGDLASAPQMLALKGRALLMLGQEDAAREALRQAGWRGEFLLAATAARSGDLETVEDLFPAERRLAYTSQLEPDLLVQLAEIEAALGNPEKAAQAMGVAVGRGWRDAKWLEQSPFLSRVLASEPGRSVLARIARELEAQRTLIDSTAELAPLLRSAAVEAG